MMQNQIELQRFQNIEFAFQDVLVLESVHRFVFIYAGWKNTMNASESWSHGVAQPSRKRTGRIVMEHGGDGCERELAFFHFGRQEEHRSHHQMRIEVIEPPVKDDRSVDDDLTHAQPWPDLLQH